MFVHGKSQRSALAASVLAVVATGVALIASASASAASSSGPVRPCNGTVELCERTFDQVVLPGSHNSMSAAELGWYRPNQTYSIPNQLRRGARALLIDTYYAKPRKLPNGETVLDKLSRAEGSAQGADMYLCHENCGLWGSSPLIEELAKIKDFLVANPREVMVIVNQDSVTPADYAKAVEQSGLIDFIYSGPTDQWPTLGEMAETEQRVVMLAEQQADGVPWYHPAYSGILKETPYTFRSWADLFVPEKLEYSCRANRGGENGSLFLMNNWTTDGSNPPDVRDARIVNSRSSLVNRARACEAARGTLPTILAVDFFGTGDVVGAARELNGVEATPFLEFKAPRTVTVKPGRRASIRVTSFNLGDAPARDLRICATAPSRLARSGSCATIESVAGTSKGSARVKVVTKKSAGGKGTVRIRIDSSAGSFSLNTKLKVKPVPRKRHG